MSLASHAVCWCWTIEIDNERDCLLKLNMTCLAVSAVLDTGMECIELDSSLDPFYSGRRLETYGFAR